MSGSVLRRIKERRADVHRRIGELRAELEILEARADEIEKFWKELVDEKNDAISIPAGTYVSPPSIAVGKVTGVADLIIQTMTELKEAGYEYAERKAIFDVIARDGHRLKSNTLRVALRRLVHSERVQRVGNLYCLVPEPETAIARKAAAA